MRRTVLLAAMATTVTVVAAAGTVQLAARPSTPNVTDVAARLARATPSASATTGHRRRGPVATSTATASASSTRTATATTAPATSAPTTSPAPAPTTAKPAAGAPFKGVANSACADLTRLTTSWFYNWGTSPGSCTGQGFVPMIAGKNEKTAATVTSALDRVAAGGYDTVLGFNEPNKSDQANLTVAQVVALWPELTAEAGIAVGSPATSADTAGKQWFSDFMAEVTARELRVDFVTAHWYGWNAGSCDPKAVEFENYLKWIESKAGGRPIWVTEWGCLNASNPDEATVAAFYQGALAVFAKHPQIARYAWYPWIANNHLVADDGSLTSLGTAFSAAVSTH